MTNSPENKVVALSKENEREGEGKASVVSISSKTRAENQEGPMDLTNFLNMMQEKKKRALGPASPTAPKRKHVSRKKADKATSAIKEAPLLQKAVVAEKELPEAIEEGKPALLHRKNPALQFLALLGVLAVALLLFGAVLHFAERQAKVLSDGQGQSEKGALVTTPADDKKLLEILSKQ